MIVKTDTKEKFIVLTPETAVISANMTEDIENFAGYATTAVPHIVINMEKVEEIAIEPAKKLAELQQDSYERDHSFVICGLQAGPAKVFDDLELTELMNITPSESEAWDIVQMEEIERELMGGFDQDTE